MFQKICKRKPLLDKVTLNTHGDEVVDFISLIIINAVYGINDVILVKLFANKAWPSDEAEKEFR